MKTIFSLMTVAFIINAMNAFTQEIDSITDLRDRKIYKTVKTGTQTWFAENLAYKVYSGCWAYNNDENYVETFGYLYNWETAREVCPTG